MRGSEMTTLKGTEKQIAYAEDIRSKAYKAVTDNVTRMKERVDLGDFDQSVMTAVNDIAQKMTKWFDTFTEASQIIDRKETLVNYRIIDNKFRQYMQKLIG